VEQGAAHYYDAENRLRVVDKRACVLNLTDPQNPKCDTTAEPSYPLKGAFEEYRYDPLGRRIWLRSRSDSTCNQNCFNTVQRFVWDGAQLLYEMRYPGHTGATSAALERDTVTLDTISASYGRVGYTHGLGIDQPLSVIRVGYGGRGHWNDPFVVVPHANWRALFDVGSFESGAYERCRTYRVGAEPDLECIEIDWPAPNVAVYLRPTGGSQIRPSSWMGSLLDLQRDASGQLYRRNRYYDPFQGRFTQEDPIGLAGGINLYGFADSDPVNYDDPFGLCPLCIAVPLVLGGGEISAGTALLWAGGAVLTGAVVAKYDELSGAISSELNRADSQLRLLLARDTERVGKSFTPAGKRAVIEQNRQENDGATRCANCGVETVPAKQHQKGVTPPSNETHVDHVKARSKGGAGVPPNGQVLCRDCNLKKRDHD
jgi:RHS repeat-associated protein